MGQITAGRTSAQFANNGTRGSYGESSRVDDDNNLVKIFDMGSLRFEVTIYPEGSPYQTTTIGYIRLFVNNKWVNAQKFFETSTNW